MKPGLSRRSANSVTGGLGSILQGERAGRSGSWKQGTLDLVGKQRNMCALVDMSSRIKVMADVETNGDPPSCCVYATTEVKELKFRLKTIRVRSWVRSCSGSPERMSA